MYMYIYIYISVCVCVTAYVCVCVCVCVCEGVSRAEFVVGPEFVELPYSLTIVLAV